MGFKGKYFPNIEDLMNWHGKALGDKTADVVAHVESLMKNPAVQPSNIAPPVLDCPPSDIRGVALSEPPAYTMGQSLATRQAYGAAIYLPPVAATQTSCMSSSTPTETRRGLAGGWSGMKSNPRLGHKPYSKK